MSDFTLSERSESEWAAENSSLSSNGLSSNEGAYLKSLRTLLKLRDRGTYDDYLYGKKRKMLRERYGIGATNAISKGAKDLSELLKIH